jgi:GNAT superfamily N-acetyltransferase
MIDHTIALATSVILSYQGDIMHLTRFTEAIALQQVAGAFLAAHEAEHCLLLGILTSLIQQPDPARPQSYLAAVSQDDAVVAVAIQTPPLNVVLSRIKQPAAVELLAADMHAWGRVPVQRRDGVPAGVIAAPEHALAFAQAWQHRTGQPFRRAIAERIYQLTQVIPVLGVPGQMRRIQEGDRNLLRDWIRAFEREALGVTTDDSDADLDTRIDRYLTSPIAGMYLWEAGGDVVAMTGHAGPTPHGMRVGPVYTPPERRGHGYASALVAALSQRLQDGGRRFCFLFTDLANPTSNHIYQTIGYVPVSDVDSYRFGNEAGD